MDDRDRAGTAPIRLSVVSQARRVNRSLRTVTAMGVLPHELYASIFLHVRDRDLFRLTTVCRGTFQLEAETLLWLHLKIGEARRGIETHCSRILTQSRFWPLIQTLEIIQDNSYTMSSSPGPSFTFLLEKFYNLSALHIICYTKIGWIHCGQLFHECTFRLRALHCTFQMDPDFISFLASQPSIQELDWILGEDLQTKLPPTVLPNLSVLSIRGFLSR
jgi:hypothetical protein